MRQPTALKGSVSRAAHPQGAGPGPARKTWNIHGGVHPPENKHQSLRTPIRQAGIPPRLTFPLSQHAGAPAEPLVEVGQRVLKGQMIAEPMGLVSAPVHASTSGTVVAIEERPVAHPSGLAAPCIVIESDGEDQWVEHSGNEDYTQMEKPLLLLLIREAGIAGLGGAGFPSAAKLGLSGERKIDTLIINGTECEPYITADDVLLRERPERIVAGTEILRHLLDPREVLIGVEDNKPEGIRAIRDAAQGTGIEVVTFPAKYPSGGEKQLIEILTGQQVPSGGLPADIGILCQNIASAVAIDDAIRRGVPLISRITTVTGQAVAEPQNFEVLLGTPMQYLLDLAGFDARRGSRIIMGGPMMGFTLTDPDVPVVKTTNCVLAPTAEELPPPPPAQPCIRCGLCSEACPASLLPQQLYWFSQGQEYEKLEDHSLVECIECGACSYVCPSNIPLVQYYRASKAQIRQLREDHAKSERSRERFEARQERLEREASARAAQRAARKKAAEQRRLQDADGDSANDPVQAAIERAQAKKTAKQAEADSDSASDPAQAAIERAQAKQKADSGEAHKPANTQPTGIWEPQAPAESEP